jgi:hypothetical protein
MPDQENEHLVDYLVVLDHTGRRYIFEDDNHWGGLIQPNPAENPGKTAKGLKVALFVSWKFGYVVLETVKRFENRFPGRLCLVGLATDNPLNPDAKISKKKRIWNVLDLPVQVIDETCTIESGLSHGIPVYTGEIKVDSFRRQLQQWNPDAIIVCVFGQIIDPFILNYPAYGIYNFHPSDLARNHGAGPAPYQDLAERNAETTVWTVHHVCEELDGGHIIGQSPPVNVRNTQGILPADPLVVYDKVMEALSPMVFYLLDGLCRKYENNQPGPLDHIDFESLFLEENKKKILLPITTDVPDEMLPESGSPIFSLI